nr:aminotransferase class I/II-fold pyridoxal phosphate-dependent enzyme [Tessaracoccus sp.]
MRAGFRVETYRYYDAGLKGVDFEGMLADIDQAAPGTIVVLHACCHNPTGYDLTAEQWDRVISVLQRRQLVPFLDMAYQGFGFGIEEDGRVVAKFVDAGLFFLLATSYSKSFSLYGERVGTLSVIAEDADVAKRVLSQLKIVIRTNYSNPPTTGAALVATVLADDELRASWADELGEMRERIKRMRHGLVGGLIARGIDDMGFIADQLGMFSYSGLTKTQMIALRSDFGVYGLDSGRMCVAALNSGNLDYVVDAIASVHG